MNGITNTELPEGFIKVLDNGYVGLIDKMGSDLSVTNAARVSFDKQSDEWTDKDSRLLKFLDREGHTSPFRHATLSFEIYAPLMVCRQWVKHVVASSHLEDGLAHNESSRRYVTEEPTFYIPAANEWRSSPDNKKQGSGEPVELEIGTQYMSALERYCRLGEGLYNDAQEAGICAEQARLFLPAYGMYVRWRWTASLGAVMHFLQQRLEHDAQKEIQEFARAVHSLTAEHFPVTMETLV